MVFRVCLLMELLKIRGMEGTNCLSTALWLVSRSVASFYRTASKPATMQVKL